ncbi:hypothetical protein PHMEG_00037843 [Phytophthora megakarya]|uniref:Retrotransposon gag domain-containing protein n=1 Tax=Phytophthora megakarya TaxID=4795 RepID=A0A225ULB5_9STRA|nr:hypothetical protein PHMEG_00037843 [Phytophthora megakarya]
MPTYHGHPHESVEEFILRAKLFMQGKCIDFTNPHNGPRVVAMLAANFRDGAASWYHAKVMVKQVIYSTLDELHAALVAEFMPPDQQFRLRAELRQCVQYGSVDDYVNDFRHGMAQIHDMHPLDQVDHFCESLKSETKVEVIYLRCGTLASAIAAARANERTHFAARHATQALPPQGVVSPATETPTPMDLSVKAGRRIDKRQCREAKSVLLLQRGGIVLPTARAEATRTGKWRGSADVSGVSVELTTEESPTTSDTSSIEIMELSTVSVYSSTFLSRQ